MEDPILKDTPVVNTPTRFVLLIATMLALSGLALSESVGGQHLRGETYTSAPVAQGLYAQPSGQVSPVAVGKMDYATSDGEGNLWVRQRGTSTVTVSNITTGNVNAFLVSPSPFVTADLDSGGGTQTAAGVALLAPASGGAVVMPGDATNGLYVQNPTAANFLVRASGSSAHDQVVSGNPLLIGLAAEDVLPTAVTEGDTVRGAATTQGQLRIVYDDNANAVGHSVAFEASHAGGGTEVTGKASSGLLKWVHISNPNTTDVFLQVFDASNPNVGTTTPTLSFCVPGGTGASNRGVYNQEFGPVGVTMSTAITYTITTTASGSTAPGSACTVGIGYK